MQGHGSFPRATDYTITVKYDGRACMVRIPDLAIPTCRKCGDQAFSVGDDDRIRAALRLFFESARKKLVEG